MRIGVGSAGLLPLQLASLPTPYMQMGGTGDEIICTSCSVLCRLLLLLQTVDKEGILYHLSSVFLLDVGK